MIPTQPTADAVLEAAIREYLTAYGCDDGLVTEWTLTIAQHIAEDDGSSSSAVSHWSPDGQPLYRTLGLVDYTVTRIRSHIAGHPDED